MRQKQYRITPRHVHAHAAHHIQKHLRLPDHGPKCRAGILWALLFYAASRITSLCAACAALRDAPSDTAAHDALIAGLPHFAELQRRLNRALQGDLPKALRQRRQPLAVDLTLIPYHGEHLHHPSEIYRSQAKSGTSHFHAYATAYVIRKGQRYTVALLSVSASDALADVLKRLLREAARAGIRPRYLLLDRGFCSVDIIRYLQAARYGWLMPLTVRGRKEDHPKGPSGSRIFKLWKKSGWARYTMTNASGRQANFAVCVKCRNRKGERNRHGREALLYAFGGMSPSSYQWVKETYRSRFGIETSYRQMNQARIRTCTKDPLLRLLYVGIALVLRNVWVWFHYEILSERRRGHRRVDLGQMSFRKMLVWLQHHVEQWLGLEDVIQAEHTTRT
jgi:DDE family transposase